MSWDRTNKQSRALFLLTISITGILIIPHNLPTVNAVTWGGSSSLPWASPNENIFPKLLRLQNGTTWLVWQITAYGLVLRSFNIFGTTGVWGDQQTLVNSGGAYDDITPTIAQLNNGTVILVWSRGLGAAQPLTYNLYTQSYTNGQWSSPTGLVVTANVGTYNPTLVHLVNGTIWLAWTKVGTSGSGDIFYKTLTNNVWGPEAPVPPASNATYDETLSSVTQAADGRVWLTYQSNQGGSPQIWYTIWNSTGWSAGTRLTTTTQTDEWPSITQDRGGSLWVFWAREIPNGTLPSGAPKYQWDLYYTSSTNNGVTWNTEAAMNPTIGQSEQHPTIFQGPDKQLWLIFDSSGRGPGNPYGTPNLLITKSDQIPMHDLAVSAISIPSSTLFRRSGDIVNVSVTVANPGEYTDSSQVNCYSNSTLFWTGSVTLSPGQVSTLTIPWNTTGLGGGRYAVTAKIVPVPGETVTANNSMNYTYVLTFKGDVNRDGRVNISDLSTVASRFGSVLGGPNYLPDADLNKDGKIDVIDLSMCAADFGKSLVLPDLAILSVNAANARIGETVKITAKVADIGQTTESSQVNLYLGSSLIGTIPFNLSPGQNVTLTFNWMPTTQPIARYSVMARVAPVPGEINTVNNSLNSTLVVTFKGDVNRDGKVDIVDLSIVGAHFGSVRGGSNYLADADLNNDGVIDIRDMAICSSQFGSVVP